MPAQPEAISPAYTDLVTYRAHGGYQLAAALVNGEMDAEAVLGAMRTPACAVWAAQASRRGASGALFVTNLHRA